MKTETERNIFSNQSPLDFRYYDPEIAKYLSEEAFTRTKLEIEVALAEALQRRGKCDEVIVEEIRKVSADITTAEVYEEENKVTKHDIRALVNCIQRRVSDRAKPIVHMTATSYDIIDTARAVMYRRAMKDVVLPSLVKLVGTLIRLTEKHAKRVQIGRTHGQHAVPITFGFALALHLDRLGQSYLQLLQCTDGLRGKFSGAVGAYNASSLFFDDPQRFEDEVLMRVGVMSGSVASQIVQPEPLMRLLLEAAITAGIMGNTARDMRNLQRTEIGEVGEEFLDTQVGSSAMPQKRNPVGFENIESMAKLIHNRVGLLFADQISEHQRDLTSSATARTYVEILDYLVYAIKRLTSLLERMKVNDVAMDRNLALTRGLILAEPMQVILASLGHPDAHEYVRQMTLQAQRAGDRLIDLFENDPTLELYRAQLTPAQRHVLADPLHYVGRAEGVALSIVDNWRDRLSL